MYIRFVTNQLDVDNERSLGIFGASYKLLENEAIPEYSRAEIRETLNWFKRHLPIPDRFVRSRKPHREDNGICWFKSHATDCMHHIRHLVHLISEHDILVRELRTELPGYIIYEDEAQVVAEPFATTPR